LPDPLGPVICLMAVSEAPDLAATTRAKAGGGDRGRSHIPIGKARKANGSAVREAVLKTSKGHAMRRRCWIGPK
jgi:hypothetical protein